MIVRIVVFGDAAEQISNFHDEESDGVDELRSLVLPGADDPELAGRLSGH